MTPLFSLLFDTLDKRLKLRAPGRGVANKVFPHHWSFLLGEIALISFIVLLLTGIFLTMFYRPTVDPTVYTGTNEVFAGQELPAAFESILRLSYDVPGGLLFRRLHRAAAHLFVAAIILHMLRVMLTGAFRRPREINYHVGVVLLLLAFATGFTGYSLPYDALAGTGIRVAYSMALSIPYVGETLTFWIFGGEFPTGDVIPRFFVLHVLILPLLIMGLIGIHLALLVRQRHTQFPRRNVDGHRWIFGKPLWPSQFNETSTLTLWIGGLLAASAVLVPWSDVMMQGPYQAGEVGNNAQPDWYMFFLEGALRLFPALEFSILGMTVSSAFFAGAVIPGFVIIFLFGYPFLERRVYKLEGDWHVLQNPLDIPLRVAFVTGTFIFLLLMSAGATNDILARYTGIPVEMWTNIFRIACIVVPPATAGFMYWVAKRRLARAGVAVPSRESPESKQRS